MAGVRGPPAQFHDLADHFGHGLVMSVGVTRLGSWNFGAFRSRVRHFGISALAATYQRAPAGAPAPIWAGAQHGQDRNIGNAMLPPFNVPDGQSRPTRQTLPGVWLMAGKGIGGTGGNPLASLPFTITII
jgi:hypothetical protein